MLYMKSIYNWMIIAAAIGFFPVYGVSETQLPGNKRLNEAVQGTDTSKAYIYSLELKWQDQENIDQMLNAIEGSREHGLIPEDYHLSEIRSILEQEGRLALDAGMASSLDSLLTDAFIRLATHLATGKTSPREADLQWAAKRRELEIDIGELLDNALNSKKVKESLENLAPQNSEYLNLKKVLAEYRQIEKDGGWKLPGNDLPLLSKGAEHRGVKAIRDRLAATQGDIIAESENENFFDESLSDQVIVFQERNGLQKDGIVGEETLEMINIPVEERISVIKANLERWRWLGGDLGDRYIEVDIAGYRLHVVEDGKQVFSSDVIVGRDDRPTPVLSEEMTYLVANPRWNIPPGILKRTIIPEANKDTAYLEERNLAVLDGDKEIDHDSIDWNSKEELIEIKMEEEDLEAAEVDIRFPYQVVQRPGPENEMGRVKFMFPNAYYVYIHDSPHESLFEEHDRTFSSGCVRISEPFELLKYLLRDDPEWDADKIKDTFGQEDEQEVALADPVEVHMVYFTARTDEQGTVYFRKDIYDRDKPLIEALEKNIPLKEVRLLSD